MKKYLKYAALAIGIGLFIFLMLPFLDLPEGHNGSARYAAQKPQISTSNPLTAIARKLWAKLSGKPVRYGLLPTDSLTLAKTADPYVAQPYEEEDKAVAAVSRTQQDSESDALQTAPDPDAENARFFLQGDNGEWVLIRQRAPEASLAGMHEISIKEDAYDRYVKQERNARFSPATRPVQTAQVPDSKWARVLAPVKRFFGFGDEKPAQTGPLFAGVPGAATARTGSVRPQTSNPSAGSAYATHTPPASWPQLISLINPAQIIKDAADLVADSMQDNADRETTRRTQQEEYQHHIQNTLQEELVRLAGGEEALDQMPKTLKCVSEKGMIREGEVDGCDNNEYKAEEEIKAANRETFRQLTGMEMPQTALIPVLGVAQSSTLEQIDPTGYDSTADMYAFMLKQSNCQQGGCFWVANAEQALQVLQPSIEAANVSFVGDPLGKFPQLKAAFVEEEMKRYEEKHPQATDEQKQEQRKLLEMTTAPHLLYTQEDIQALLAQLQPAPADGQNTTAPDNEPAQVTPVLYLPDAADAKKFADQYGYQTPFVFGRQQHLVFSEDAGSSVASRSDIVTRDLAAHVNLMQDLMAQTQQDAAGKAVQNTFAPVIRDIQEQASEELKQFDLNNSLGTTLK